MFKDAHTSTRMRNKEAQDDMAADAAVVLGRTTIQCCYDDGYGWQIDVEAEVVLMYGRAIEIVSVVYKADVTPHTMRCIDELVMERAHDHFFGA